MKTDWTFVLQEGVIISVIVITIVFTVLFISYKLIVRNSNIAHYLLQKLHKAEHPADKIGNDLEVPPDHSAAIAMALYLYDKVHDEESNIITIERKSRYYSPWSSKYYNMRKPMQYYRK